MSSPPPKPDYGQTSPEFIYRHVPKNATLFLLSLICLPLSATLTILSLLYSKLTIASYPSSGLTSLSTQHDELSKTILVTGISMAKGLTIARILAQHTHHRIIGADTSPFSPGRFSRSISAFYILTSPDGDNPEPYIDSLLSIIRMENVDLWISCSSVVAAVEDGQVVKIAEEMIQREGKRTGKKFEAVQFREEVIERLHEKDRFIEYIKLLGLRTPESYRCTNAEEALEVLWKSNSEEHRKGKGPNEKKRRFIMKPIGVDDRARNSMMTLLPFPSSDETEAYVKNLGVSKSNPFQLQQYINGTEYCTHALIIRGRVAAFVACPSSDLLMHYEALSPSTHLSQEMLAFTQRVAEDGGKNFTGHLSFDFLAEGERGDMTLFPIECNPRAHTAVCLFSETPDMAPAYLSIFNSNTTSKSFSSLPIFPRPPYHSCYWIGHDLVTLLLVPFINLVFYPSSFTLSHFEKNLTAFWQHVIYWRDGTFNTWDPVPFFMLYHVYWPWQFLVSLSNKDKGRWSRLNVSTTKVFEC